MTGAQFALHVMMSFDLDICRCGIFKDEYIVCGGGIDTIETFFNEDLLLLMDLDTMIWSGRGWRGMNNNEKHERRNAKHMATNLKLPNKRKTIKSNIAC